MKENKTLENIKTAAIVVLFLTTILLLFLVWRPASRPGSFHLPSILSSEERVWVPAAEEFIQPEFIVYGYGDGSFTRDSSNADMLFAQATGMIANASSASTIAVSEITKEQYSELLRDYNSIRICFGYGLPFSEFCDRNGINKQPGFDSVQRMEEIFVSSAVDESFFIIDGDKCYRFMCDIDLRLAEQWMPQKEEGAQLLYSASDILGVENQTPIPLAVQSSLTELECEAEYEHNSEELRIKIAKAVFDENFQFVRRITDSFGNITYMYGYGQKTLNCTEDGSYSYRTEASVGADEGFYASLTKAIEFMAKAGGWGDSSSALNYRLSAAKEEGGARNKVYSFEFSQQAAGQRICSEAGPAISVQVCAGEVIGFTRTVLSYNQASSELAPAADAVNLIAGNCNLMYNVLRSNILAENSDEAFSYTCESLESINTGYIRTEESLTPGWIIRFKDGSEFYFNLYTAQPLGFRSGLGN